jgi:predicted nucleic acid-binding protein
MQKIFFDSSAILTWYKTQNNSETINNFLKQVFNSEIEGYICEVNLAEILYQIARHENNFALAQEFVDDLLNQVGLLKVPTEWGLWQKAAMYKMAGNIALPDCILIASAKKAKAKILTCDPEFKQFEMEAEIIWF